MSSRDTSSSRGVWTSSRVAAQKAQVADAVSSQHKVASSSSASRWASKPLGNSSASRWATAGPSSQPTTSPKPSAPAPASSTSTPPPRLPPSAASTPRVAAPSLSSASTPHAPLFSPNALRRRDDSQRLGAAVDPMSLIASPSRGIQGASSTMLGSEGEQDLTNSETQSRYRAYISKRIQAHCDKFALPLDRFISPAMPGEEDEEDALRRRQAITSLDEVLLLVRKLREGVVASRRLDAAAVEVYHLALFLAVVTLNKGQLGASIHRAVFDVYTSVPVAAGPSTSAWPSNVSSDFTSLPGGEHNELDLFVDSQESREHTASLLLLSRTCLADERQRGSLEDDFMQLRARVIDAVKRPAAGTAPQRDHILLASEVDRLARQGDILQLRRLLLGQHWCKGKRLAAPTVYQRMLISQALPRWRATAWAQLRKAYMSVPLPRVGSGQEGGLVEKMGGLAMNGHATAGGGGGDDWLEKVLLVDGELLPPSSRSTQDHWGDGDGEAQRLKDLRAARLAAVFRQVGLTSGEAAPSNAVEQSLAPWQGRIASSATSGQRSLKVR